MSFIVIGCGSIGKRHIKNLLSLTQEKIYAFDIDSCKLREVNKIDNRLITSNRLEELLATAPKIALICVPSSLHIEYATMAASSGCHLFIEKPLSSNFQGIQNLMKIVKRKKLATMVGCNMRFHWAIKKIKTLLNEKAIGKIVSARIEAGQYLPDWHPWADYRNSYSAKKHLGGGIILDAIHELDYPIWFFGRTTNIVGLWGKLSNLQIDTEDVAEIILKFHNGPIVNIHMDYIQRKYSRSCKIIGEKGTIKWERDEHCVKAYFANIDKWKLFNEQKRYNSNQMFVDELKYFIQCVKKCKKTFNDVEFASKVLKVALAAKKKNAYV